MEPMLITMIILFSWLIVWMGTKGTKCRSVKREAESPCKRVRLRCEIDPSGRFMATGRMDKASGLFEATVTTRRNDIPLVRYINAKTKEELEQKVEKVFEDFSRRWNTEMKYLKLH